MAAETESDAGNTELVNLEAYSSPPFLGEVLAEANHVQTSAEEFVESILQSLQQAEDNVVLPFLVRVSRLPSPVPSCTTLADSTCLDQSTPMLMPEAIRDEVFGSVSKGPARLSSADNEDDPTPPPPPPPHRRPDGPPPPGHGDHGHPPHQHWKPSFLQRVAHYFGYSLRKLDHKGCRGGHHGPPGEHSHGHRHHDHDHKDKKGEDNDDEEENAQKGEEDQMTILGSADLNTDGAAYRSFFDNMEASGRLDLDQPTIVRIRVGSFRPSSRMFTSFGPLRLLSRPTPIIAEDDDNLIASADTLTTANKMKAAEPRRCALLAFFQLWIVLTGVIWFYRKVRLATRARSEGTVRLENGEDIETGHVDEEKVAMLPAYAATEAIDEVKK